MEQEVNEVDYSHLHSITECSLTTMFISASMEQFLYKESKKNKCLSFQTSHSLASCLAYSHWLTAAVIDEHVVINAVLSSIQQHHITVPDLNVLKPM